MTRRNVTAPARGSGRAPFARTTRTAIFTAVLSVSSLFAAGQAIADPNEPDPNAVSDAQAEVAEQQNVVAALITEIAGTDQALADLQNDVAAKQQSVNQTLVDLQNANDAAAAASSAVALSQQALESASAQIATAQQAFDTMVRSAYTQGSGPSTLLSVLGGTNVEQVLGQSSIMDQLLADQQETVSELQEARNIEANKISVAKASEVQAVAAQQAAAQSKIDAESIIVGAYEALANQQARQESLATLRTQAEAALAAAKADANDAEAQQAVYQSYLVKKKEQEQAAAALSTPAAKPASDGDDETAGDETSTATSPGTAAASTTAVAAASDDETDDPATIPDPLAAAQAFAEGLLGSIGELFGQGTPAPTADDQAKSRQSTSTTPKVSGQAAVEKVIARGMTQLGVRYSWGGGNTEGPTVGISDNGGNGDAHRDYANAGFDCSGLMIYMFAAVGFSLPHYTGYQYNMGEHVPLSEMKRGDMIFYGSNASQHVALYLGDEQMIEAPHSGSVVKISPVRTSGAMPYVVRMIDN